MRSAVRLLPLLLVLAACGRERPSAATAAPAPPTAPGSAAPDTASRAGLDHLPNLYGGFGSQRMLLQALADTAAKFAAQEIRREPTIVGGWEDTTRLLAAEGRFALAYWSGGGDHRWHEVWAAVNGRVVLADSTARSGRVVLLSQWNQRSVALVELQRDGGCPVAYRIVEHGYAQRPTITPELGNCTRPSIARRYGQLRLRFATSPGHAAAEYEYLGYGRIRGGGLAVPPAAPDSLYLWGQDESGAIATLWHDGRYFDGTDTTALLAYVATPAGAFTLSRYGSVESMAPVIRAVLADSVVLWDELSRYTSLDSYVEIDGRPVALLSIADGGNGCGEMYRIASTIGERQPVITREFGSCGGVEVRLDGARMDMRMEGYWTNWAERQPGFVPPPAQGYRYRGGTRVDRIY